MTFTLSINQYKTIKLFHRQARETDRCSCPTFERTVLESFRHRLTTVNYIFAGNIFALAIILLQVTRKPTLRLLKERLGSLAASSTSEEVVLNILSVIGLSCHGIL